MQHDADREIDIQETEAGFGERVREARVEKGWSQRDFAAKLNLDASAVSRLEKGTRAIRLGEAAIIAAVLGIDLDYLVYGMNPVVALRQYRTHADEMMHQTREAAVEMANHYVLIADLLESNPELFRALGDDGEPDLPTTVDEYFAWVLDRVKHLFRLPETDDRIVNRDEKLVRQITALVEATVANVISTVDFPEEEINASRLRHPAVQGRLARGLAALIPIESRGGDDAPEA